MGLHSYLQIIFSLVVFLGVAYGAQRLAKTYQKKRFTTEMKIIDRIGIEAGVTLSIVSVRGQDYLLSVGGKDVKLLQKL